ncbi:MAG: DUF4197 domain-containing protein [Spirochaetaceae bacterium]|nr:DUF4197 domain-containing protein [Spirochaetaceae bacterium]MBP5329395.1 DUF4197 domain-containing protein [Spirochaetaceae bacterium]
MKRINKRFIAFFCFFCFALCCTFSFGLKEVIQNRGGNVPSTPTDSQNKVIIIEESPAESGQNTSASSTTTSSTSASSYYSTNYTNDDAILAIKDILLECAITATETLAKQDAYYKNPLYFIDLPADAAEVTETVRKAPGGKSLLNDVVLRINRAAETTAQDVLPMLKFAISDLNIRDGVAIVTGGKDAATKYLKEKAHEQIMELYSPKISKALSEPLVGKMSADEAWKKVINTYNKTGSFFNKIGNIFGKDDEMQDEATSDLSQYTTEKALEAIFLKMAEEEGKIRSNPRGYASENIKKVFSSR